MAELHDKYESQFRTKLTNKKYRVTKKHPFVGYRPDIYAIKGKEKVVVEIEIESTLHSDHTRHQLKKMLAFIKTSKYHTGYLVVPIKVKKQAKFLISILSNKDKIIVIGI